MRISNKDILKKVISKSVKTDNGCLEYRIPNTSRPDVRPLINYNYKNGKQKTTLASRAVWELTNGEITNGLLVLHSCDNQFCININHLRLGTQKENMDDMLIRNRRSYKLAKMRRAMTKCKNGHEFTPDNTKVYEKEGVFRSRICLTCRKEYHAARYRRLK